MPHDLFGDVVTRPPSVRTRRSSLVAASLGAHVAVILGVVLLSVIAPDVLPFPRRVLAITLPIPVRLVDIPLPKRRAEPASRRPASSTAAVIAEPAAPAPIDAPVGITSETGDEIGIGSGGGGASLGDDVASVPGVSAGTFVPAPPPAPPAGPIRLHAGIRAPRKITDVAPQYPALARLTRVEGVVILEATIDTQGAVSAVRVLGSVPLLDQAAVDAVRAWRFEPARLNDQPVAVIMTVTVRFALTSNR